MSWSRLFRDDPVRLEVELKKAGTTLNNLALDTRDVPELSDMTGMSANARRLLALQYFGDEGHPQPENRRERKRRKSTSSRDRRVVMFKTPAFGQLPRLPDDERPAEDGDGAEFAETAQTGVELPMDVPRLPGGSTLAVYTHAKLQSAVKRFDKPPASHSSHSR